MSTKIKVDSKTQPTKKLLGWWRKTIAGILAIIVSGLTIYGFFRVNTPTNNTFKTTVNIASKPEQGGSRTTKTVDPPHQASPAHTVRKDSLNDSQKSAEPLVSYSDFVNNGEDKKDIAVLVVDNDGEFQNSLASKIAGLYQVKGYSVSRSLFRYNFIKSKYLARLENADADIIDRLNLSQTVKYVVIGHYSNSFENGEYTKYISRAQFKVSIISCSYKSQLDAFKIGVANGFDDKDHAEQGAIEKIVTDYQLNHSNLAQ
jgi:hypothetical protein